MNNYYNSFLQQLSLPSAILDCAMGRVRLPVASVAYPPPWYGYPPAFIPFWSEGHIYIGLWRHWFTERPLTFVKMYVRGGRTLVEIARTCDQLLYYMTIDAIVSNDGIQPEVEQFAEAAGITNLPEIDAACLQTGDNPRGFTALRQFQINIPLACLSDPSHYDGWFPRADFSTPIAWWQHCSSLEIDDETRALWPSTVAVPPWLLQQPTPRLLSDYIEAGDLRSAWFLLNSAGWSLADARAAIMALSAAAHDDLFSTLAAAWLMASENEFGGY